MPIKKAVPTQKSITLTVAGAPIEAQEFLTNECILYAPATNSGDVFIGTSANQLQPIPPGSTYAFPDTTRVDSSAELAFDLSDHYVRGAVTDTLVMTTYSRGDQ